MYILFFYNGYIYIFLIILFRFFIIDRISVLIYIIYVLILFMVSVKNDNLLELKGGLSMKKSKFILASVLASVLANVSIGNIVLAASSSINIGGGPLSMDPLTLLQTMVQLLLGIK